MAGSDPAGSPRAARGPPGRRSGRASGDGYPPPVVLSPFSRGTHVATVRPRHAVAHLLVLALFATALVALVAPPADAQSPEFRDLDSTLHAEAIRLVAEDGITQGYPDGTFRPREDVRRDQMATFLANALRLDPQASSFPDVPGDSPHVDAIGALAASGITSGFRDGTYRPREFVTRGQMATFLANGLDLPAGNATFDDVPADYAHAAGIAAIADAGITSGFGDGTFRPNALVKRDQMASFLAAGIPLPREVADPCNPTASTRSQVPSTDVEGPEEAANGQAAGSDFESAGEDLDELQLGERLEATIEHEGSTRSDAAPTQTAIGPAVPGLDYPITSALRTAAGALEVHSFELPSASRSVRVGADGDITGLASIPAGTRTWATAQLGDWVYVGQWGPQHGAYNLFRYRDTGGNNRQVQTVAAVPSGGEFWTLASQGTNRLWAGTRAHNVAAFRDSLGLATQWSQDARHVIHRINPDTNQLANVTFCTPNLPANHRGARPDVKQIATAGNTVYVGFGQQAGSTRLYAFEPGNRAHVPYGDVRDLTPAGVAGATSIFALEATNDLVALGTQASSAERSRVVVLDAGTGQVRANVRLPAAESRVDDVAIRGRRVVATGFSGTIYDIDVPTSGTVTQATRTHEAPVPDQFSRFVEIAPDGSIRGVSNRGFVWTRATNGELDVQVLGDDDRVESAPGLPHSLHAGSEDVAVGANGAVVLRDAGDPGADPRTAGIAGEAKALTSDADGNTFAAVYPSAALWRVDAGGDQAEQVAGWTREFTRPAATAYEPLTDRVLVVARHEASPQSEARSSPWANFQFRPSRLFTFDADVDAPTSRSGGTALTRPSGSSEVPVEASSVDVGPDGEVYVGDTRGGVQRLDAAGGGWTRTWYRPPTSADTYRRVVDVEVVDGVAVVVTSGVPARRDEVVDARTTISELDPQDGRRLTQDVVSTAWAVPDAVTTGSVTIMPSRSVLRQWDRTTDTYSGQSHPASFSFGGPYASLNDECELYSFRGERANNPTYSLLARSEVEVGACAPEPPDDGGDPPAAG
ncbi:S-layer homology domain-containing protein [Nitriliruptoraceae bacterium ZYF776]|nr:S-layer homology domain-containing protein [Profundirhabdus halotolerans]